MDEYAYSGKPLLIKNAAKNWKAMDAFSFEFFRELQNAQFRNKYEEEVNFAECQFFPYNSEGKYKFQNLQVRIIYNMVSWGFEFLTRVFKISDSFA